jgi:ADP-heptose:LPS heptosyltransferase
MHDLSTPTPVALGASSRILVVKLAGLGDLLLTLPALRALHRHYPAGRVDVLTTAAAAPLLADSPLVHHIYTVPSPRATAGRAASVLRAAAPLVSLRRQHYDALLLLHHLTLATGRLKHRALVGAIGARLTAGLDNGHGSFLDLRVPDPGFGARHEAEYFSAVAAAVGGEQGGSPVGPTLTDLGWGAIAGDGGGRADRPRIALHAGSGSYSVARRWPLQRFAELAAALHESVDAEFIVVGGPEEAELSDQLLELLGRPAWAASVPRAAPKNLAHLLASCDLFIGNDSFPMHLATAVGLPVVAIFGPSNASAWGPYAPEAPGRVRIIRRTDLPCSPCFYRGHALGTPEGCPPRPCLTELGIRPVLAAAQTLLRQERHAVLGG